VRRGLLQGRQRLRRMHTLPGWNLSERHERDGVPELSGQHRLTDGQRPHHGLRVQPGLHGPRRDGMHGVRRGLLQGGQRLRRLPGVCDGHLSERHERDGVRGLPRQHRLTDGQRRHHGLRVQPGLHGPRRDRMHGVRRGLLQEGQRLPRLPRRVRWVRI